MPERPSVAILKGTITPRIDAPLKVSGTAVYASDTHLANMAFAVPVCATIAKGKITKLDDSRARKMKGVLAVYSHGQAPAMFRVQPDEGMSSRIDESRPPFEDEIIRYYGQYVAVVMAETFEIAQRAARAIQVSYKAEKFNIDADLKQDEERKVESQRGDAKKYFAKAAVQVDETYVTPVEVHNPIELHATVAEWDFSGSDGPRVTLHETSQAVVVHQNVLAQILGVPKQHVRVVSKFLGSGFGGKLWAWPHSALAAVAARDLRRPVKLVIERKMAFTNVGHRPRTQQNMQIGADKDGKLISIHHSYATQSSIEGEYRENCGEATASLYKVDNMLVSSGLARRNQSVPTSMRGPGAVPGLFALESAMDELATKLGMDPVQLRIMNDTLMDQSKGVPFSSRHLKECLEVGAQKFGWSKRNAKVGSMRDGDEILGWGVAACTWQAKTLDCESTVELLRDGTARVSVATQDIGTGTYTVLAEIVKEETGLPLNKINVVLGDTELPPGPVSGGSMATASVIPSVSKAAKEAIKILIKGAVQTPSSPFHGLKPDELKFADGRLQKKESRSGVDLAKIMQTLNMASVTGRSSSKGTMAEKKPDFTAKSFGAQFVEIGWQPEIARLRVRRVVTVMDGGRIINYQPARNQIEGAIVMGIGMGLFEHAVYDGQFGNPINDNLADYVMAVHADCPEIDVTFLDYPDKHVNDYGARGVGEIGLAGVAPAITSAVYHATGIRVRELPVRIEDLLAGSTTARATT